MNRHVIVAAFLITVSALSSLPARTWADTYQPQPAPIAAPGKTAAVSGVDALILHLHDTLHISTAQEAQWQKVAAVMRDNAATMSRLAKARSESTGTATAVEDLKSYSEISEAHADSTRKLIPVFEALYDALSIDQKAAADQEFRDHYHANHGRKH